MDKESLAVITLHIQACQYVTAAGLVMLLYDHMLTFDQEVQLIWSTKLTLPSLLFLFNRYVVPVAMIIRTKDLSGIATQILSDNYCKWSIGIATILGLVTIGISNILVLLRLWVVWDGNKQLMYWTGAACFTSLAAGFLVAGFVFPVALPYIVYNQHFHACLLVQTPRVNVGYLWLPGLVFEVIVFFVVFWDALERPRTRDSEITKALYRDGFLYFFVLCVLRLINMLLGIIAPLSLIFLGVLFIWSAVNIAVSRLILNSRQLLSDAATTALATTTTTTELVVIDSVTSDTPPRRRASMNIFKCYNYELDWRLEE